MDNLDQELYDVLNVHQPTGCAGGHCWGVDKLKTIITTQKQELLSEIEKELEPKLRRLYYHDPDELGEDAFNNLGDDEVEEVLAIITTKRGSIQWCHFVSTENVTEYQKTHHAY